MRPFFCVWWGSSLDKTVFSYIPLKYKELKYPAT